MEENTGVPGNHTRGRWEPASLRQVLPNAGTVESIGTRSGELRVAVFRMEQREVV